MATDNWPVDYIYISRRLATEIVDQDSAARRPRRLSKLVAGLPGLGVSAEFTSGARDQGNLFDLARRATDAVTDLTGTLEAPGRYVRTTLDLSWDAIPVLAGWDDAGNVPVASFFADVRVEGIGGVFLGLFGSASNLLGRVPAEGGSGWMPSDLLGLYRILDHTTEPGEPTVSAEFIDDDLRLTPEQIIRQTVTIYRAARPLRGHGTMEALFKCYMTERPIDLSWHDFLQNGDDGGGLYGLAILGAPIWVATPTPRADRHAIRS